MKLREMHLSIAETVRIQNNRSKKFEFGLTADINTKDNPDFVFDTLKDMIEARLTIFKDEISIESGEVEIMSRKTSTNHEIKIVSDSDQKIEEGEGSFELEEIFCPKCGEIMLEIEGKEYLMCSEHWGYPDMIQEGKVRKRAF